MAMVAAVFGVRGGKPSEKSVFRLFTLTTAIVLAILAKYQKVRVGFNPYGIDTDGETPVCFK